VDEVLTLFSDEKSTPNILPINFINHQPYGREAT